MDLADPMVKVLERLHRDNPNLCVIQGGAKGADFIARTLCDDYGIECITVPANWSAFGRAAGAIRNIEMLQYRPDLVLAFWDGESRGTKHMMDQARKRNIPVETYMV